jgi:23S rRNA pseudouridine1911/1915/1917 synthase
MEIKVIYEDSDLLVADKPAGIVVFCEAPAEASAKAGQIYLIDELIQKYPELKNAGEAPRYGIVHRLDKDTSGIVLVAKSTEALIFLQKQFKNRGVEKKYICLVEGEIKDDFGEIKTLIARSKKDFRKQIVPPEGQKGLPAGRQAVTEYKVLERLKDYTLLEVNIKTGRRHQIRCHFSYLKHPVAGDRLYAFKNSKIPEGLTRQFLHASYLKIKLLNGKTHEFYSELPEDLKHVKITRTI